MKIFEVIERKFRRLYRDTAFLLAGDKLRIKLIRSYGVRIGKNCFSLSNDFSTEPFLVEIGDHVAIASNTHFITHDGTAWLFREEIPDLDVFGPIKVGNNCVIGMGCYILPNTVIGNNCIVGAGSVVRGRFPDNSVIMGNPAKIVMQTSTIEKLIKMSKNALHTKNMTRKEKHAYIKRHFDL